MKVRIRDNRLDQLVNHLIQELKFDYENHSVDMSVLAAENFYFRTMSAQVNMVILKKEASFILIDIMGGGGGSGLLNIDWGSEKGYTGKVTKVINKYSAAHNLIVETVDRTG